MNEDLGPIRAALRRGIPPRGAEAPRRDLWPDLARRLGRRSAARVHWFDWIVAAGAVTAAVALPEVFPTLLYLL